MGKPISIDQSHAVMATLAANVDWSGLDGDMLHKYVIKDPKHAGAEFTRFLQNNARLQVVGNHLIDCDASPFTPEGWEVVDHKKGGQLVWNPTEISLHLSDAQKGGKYIEGNKLRKELANKPVLNANVLDYLLANPSLIPEEWKGKAVFFWGTIYRYSDGSLCVRCLCFGDGQWQWDCDWLVDDWGGSDPAALSAR